MLTPADIRFWTDIEVSEEECRRFSAVAETRLNADGGYALLGELRVQLLSYLVAALVVGKQSPDRKTSERIGDYSYTLQVSSGNSNGWYDVYQELLNALIVESGAPSSSNGGIVEHTVDWDMIQLNREYGAYRL